MLIGSLLEVALGPEGYLNHIVKCLVNVHQGHQLDNLDNLEVMMVCILTVSGQAWTKDL